MSVVLLLSGWVNNYQPDCKKTARKKGEKRKKYFFLETGELTKNEIRTYFKHTCNRWEQPINPTDAIGPLGIKKKTHMANQSESWNAIRDQSNQLMIAFFLVRH